MQQPIVSAIVAMSENRIIGKNNQLPWRLPADLKHFKAITTGHVILMGRKTYESIGKPLPNRINMIITRDVRFNARGCKIVHSVEEAIEQASAENQKEMFIIGGAQIYQQCLPQTQRIYLTIVHHHFDGDVSFPELNQSEWSEIERIRYPADNENIYSYSFVRLEREISYYNQKKHHLNL